jgi:hypothetical protein
LRLCALLVLLAVAAGCQPRNRLGNRELGQSSLTNGRSVFTGNPNDQQTTPR